MRDILFIGGPLHLTERHFANAEFMAMGYLGENDKYWNYTYWGVYDAFTGGTKYKSVELWTPSPDTVVDEEEIANYLENK